MEDKIILENLQAKYDLLVAKGYDVLGVFLYGSQNYGTATETSDIDARAIVIPKLHDLIFNTKPANTTIICDNNEHIDVKDIRLMHENFIKQSTTYLEILFTKYAIINPIYAHLYQTVLSNRDAIVRLNEVRNIKNIAYMIQNRLKRMTHERPGNEAYIKQCGYDYKEFINIIREYDLMKKYISHYGYDFCLDATDKIFILSVKENPQMYSSDTAVYIASNFALKAMELYNVYQEKNKEQEDNKIIEMLNNVTYKIITTRIKQELNKK